MSQADLIAPLEHSTCPYQQRLLSFKMRSRSSMPSSLDWMVTMSCGLTLQICLIIALSLIMPPTSKKLEGHIASGLFVRPSGPSVRPSFRPFVTLFDASHNFKTANATVLKFHIWIPHEKIADTYFFS